MTIEEYALEKRKLLRTWKISVGEVARDINGQTYDDGTPLSTEDKEKILAVIQYGRSVNGKYPVCGSDNSAWLKAVALLRSQVNGVRKK